MSEMPKRIWATADVWDLADGKASAGQWDNDPPRGNLYICASIVDALRRELAHLSDMASSANDSLNSTRLIMQDKGSRDLAGEIVADTNKAIRRARQLIATTGAAAKAERP